MKRSLIALFLLLTIVPVTGNAAWWKRHNKPKAATAEAPAAAEREKQTPKPIAATAASPEKKSMHAEEKADDGGLEAGPVQARPGLIRFGAPLETSLTKATGKIIDVRLLPQAGPEKFERPEREEPEVNRTPLTPGTQDVGPIGSAPIPVPPRSAPAPAPLANFAGLDFATFGNGHPPDTVGDVGPTYYIQSINTSLGIFRKSDGALISGVSLNTFMHQGNFGNLCDTNNFGDPIILYDTFEDRWVITDFAFQLSGGGVVSPPGAFQCFAVSMTNDPVVGGWNFYSVNTPNFLGDYPKLGVWTDGIYMTLNSFANMAQGTFLGSRAYAFNKAQMYAGKPSVQVVSFDIPGGDFTVLPSNARLQTGTPPPGTPNYYVSSWLFLNALTVYKFHVDWNNTTLSSFSGPDTPTSVTSWPNQSVANSPSQGGNALDVLQIRAMMQNQYTNIGGVESLWDTHTVRRVLNGFAAPRWYQVVVTGGTVAATIAQATTFDPDGADVINRFMPSIAVDRAGDVALGYSTSNATTKPAIKYAGRLAADPPETFSQSEQLLIQGAGTQTGSCGGTCTRWGDYSAMSLDPDGCTFWYTNMYYAADGLNHQTRIGSFAYPSCTPVGAGGTLTGTVTAQSGGAPINGAIVTLGARSTTTNASGVYTFSVPAGLYPTLTVSKSGFTSGSASTLAVTDGGTTTQNFALAGTPPSLCFTDTTRSDFQVGTQFSVDVDANVDNIVLSKPFADTSAANNNVTGSGVGFDSTNWVGQTFTAGATGQLFKADIRLFCSSCSGTFPNVTLSVRATTTNVPSTSVPTGADLGSATIPGFNSGASAYFTVTFPTPIPVTAGTMYALVLRPVANPSVGLYAMSRSVINSGTLGVDVYSGGARVSSANTGGTWSIPTTGGVTSDAAFDVFIDRGYVPTGNQVSPVRDSNAASALTPIWSTLSWNNTAPANTSVKFQIAASNSDTGPFNFVGPDGTAGTFYTTSPASLTQFYGKRYLEYKAILSTSDNTQTPILSDVAACVTNVDCSGTPTITPTPTQVCSNSVGNTASGPAGETSYAWSITNGTIVGSTTSQSVTYTAGASGNVQLLLNVIEPGGCQKSSSINIPINPIPPTATITPGGATTFCTGGSVTLSSDAASGNQWYLNTNPIGGATGTQYVASLAGDYTVQVTNGSSCVSAMSSIVTVTVNPVPAKPAISGTDFFCTFGSTTLTSSSATGNQWFENGFPIGGATNQTYDAVEIGDYNVQVTTNGCSSPMSDTLHVSNPTPHQPVVTTNGPTTFCQGGSVTLQSNSATGIKWYKDGNLIVGANSQNYVATASGSYTCQLNNTGCLSQFSDPTVVTVNPLPATPTITPGGPTTFCAGGSVTLTSSAGSGNQWYLNGNPIGGATNNTYSATASGSYTVKTTDGNNCTSAASAATVVTANPLPATPTITPGGPTTFCTGGSVTLTSSAASGNQWFLNGNPIGGATNTTYSATASGSYTVKTTDGNNCTSAASTATVVTINPIPATPTITLGGPTTFCAGGSVTLTSSSATGNQWSLNGNPIGGATNQQYVANASGNYTVTTTASGCTSAASAPTTVTVNPNPNATITASATVVTGSTGNIASVANAGAGATYTWGITNGTITGGAGTNSITFTAGAVGTLSLNVTVTTSAGCSDSKSANINVTLAPPSIGSITPSAGPYFGTTPITVNGANFVSGATITLGGTAATNVVFVSSTKLTAKTAAHAGGIVNVVVTNPDTQSATLVNGFTYQPRHFDANGDNVIDPSDIFYLISYLFLNGPAPQGSAGMLSGDANGDGAVDPSDIFYLVNFLFTGGQQPYSEEPGATTMRRATTDDASIGGTIALGRATRRGDRVVVPVTITRAPGSITPYAMSLSLRFSGGDATDVVVHHAGATKTLQSSFETTRRTSDGVAYLVTYDEHAAKLAIGGAATVVAEIELTASDAMRIDVDPELTMLSDQGGIHSASVGSGRLRVSGTSVGAQLDKTPERKH